MSVVPIGPADRPGRIYRESTRGRPCGPRCQGALCTVGRGVYAPRDRGRVDGRETDGGRTMEKLSAPVLEALAVLQPRDVLTCRGCRVVSRVVDVLTADLRCPRCHWPMP